MNETIIKPIIAYLEDDSKHNFPVIIIETDPGLHPKDRKFGDGIRIFKLKDKNEVENSLNSKNYEDSPLFSWILNINMEDFGIVPNDYWSTYQQETKGMSTKDKLQWINDEFEIGYTNYQVFRGSEADRMINFLENYLC